jgi:aryl-alcohol dehydrogenase-like predicted oxidoreductase
LEYRNLGRSGLIVSAVGLGCNNFGGRSDAAATRAVVHAALDLGVNFYDTADTYGTDGASEDYVGRALAGRRHEVVLATKFARPMAAGEGASRRYIMSAVEASLKRLGTDYIDLYLQHIEDKRTPIEETLRALDDLVRAGMVRYIGCSNLMAWQIAKALGVSAAEGLARFETVQAYYSIASRDIEREIAPLMAAEQQGLMVWSPLAGGLLSGKFRRDAGGPNNARRSGFDFPPVDRERAFTVVDAMRPVAERHDVSVARVALAWLLHQKVTMSVIIGAKTPEQLRDNIAASDLRLGNDELAALDKASALTPEYPAWMVERQNSDRLPPERRG